MTISENINYRDNLIRFRDSEDCDKINSDWRIKLQHEIDRMDNLIGNPLSETTLEDVA